MTSTERFMRRLRLVPYPPRAAELEEQFLQLRAEAREELAAAEASGEVRGFWQRRKFMQRRLRGAHVREMVQIRTLAIMWLMYLLQPWVTLFYKSHGFLAGALCVFAAGVILDPFLIWIGSFVVPHGGFRRWQVVIVYVLSFALAMYVQVLFRRFIAGH